MAMEYGMNLTMDYSAPMVSTVMPSAIDVDENTPNLQEIQSYPVVMRDGEIHFHQDPISGALYKMTDNFHTKISEIIENKKKINLIKDEYVEAYSSLYSDVDFFSPILNSFSIKNDELTSFNQELNKVNTVIEEINEPRTIEIDGSFPARNSLSSPSLQSRTSGTISLTNQNVLIESTNKSSEFLSDNSNEKNLVSNLLNADNDISFNNLTDINFMNLNESNNLKRNEYFNYQRENIRQTDITIPMNRNGIAPDTSTRTNMGFQDSNRRPMNRSPFVNTTSIPFGINTEIVNVRRMNKVSVSSPLSIDMIPQVQNLNRRPMNMTATLSNNFNSFVNEQKILRNIPMNRG